MSAKIWIFFSISFKCNFKNSSLSTLAYIWNLIILFYFNIWSKKILLNNMDNEQICKFN